MHTTITSGTTMLAQSSAAQTAREQAQAQAARDQAQAAREQAQQLKEQIRAEMQAAREGTAAGDLPSGLPSPPTPPQPPDLVFTGTGTPFGDNVIPPQAVDIVAIVGVTLVCCVVGFPLARAIARWIDRRGAVVAAPREVMNRLDAIEQAVESVAVEVERINEGQRFTARMLSEQTHQPARDFRAAEREVAPLGSAPLNAADNAPANARRS